MTDVLARPDGPGSCPSGHAPTDREATPGDPSRGSPAPGVQWWAWSEPDADSDPSDPGVGHSTDWLIGRWPSGADEPECKILIGSGRNAELIARRVAEKLRSILNTDFIKASKDSTETRPVCDLHKDCPEDTHLCSWPKCMSAKARESTWGSSATRRFQFDRPLIGRVEDALLRLGRAAIRTRGIGQHEEAARAQFECLTDIERLVGEQLEEEAAASWSWDEIGSRLRDCSIHTVADHERERYTLQIGCPDLQNMQAIRDGMVQLRDAAPSATTAADVAGIDLKALAGAIDNSDHGYSIKLKSLTEAGSVYTLDLCDGSGLIEFADRDDAREHAERHRSLARAKAAMTFLSRNAPRTEARRDETRSGSACEGLIGEAEVPK